jgi:hypothetical protein
MNSMKNYIKNNLLFLVLISQPLLDILAYFQDGSAVSVAGYVRLIYTIAIPAYTLLVTKDRKKFVLIMSVIASFALLHIANGFRVGYISLFADVKYMLLVLHMPILLISFIYLFEKTDIMSQIIRGLKVNTVIITVVFFFTYITKSGSYTYADYNLGWTGWYLIPNAQSIIMVSLLPFMVYFLIIYFKKYFPIPMLAIIFMYIENGTKSAFYGLVLIFAGFLCYIVVEYLIKKETKFPLYNVVMLAVLIVVTVGSYNYSPREVLDINEVTAREEEQLKLDEEAVDEEVDEEMILSYINKELLDRFGKEKVLAAYGDELSAYTFADMRLKKRIYGELVWDESDILTKLVGFEYSQMQHNGDNFDLENDLPAILYYYGYLGAIGYVSLMTYFLLRLLMMLIRKFKECLNLYNFTILISWGLQLGLAAYTGYILRRPNVSFYLMIVLMLIYCRTEALKKDKEEV